MDLFEKEVANLGEKIEIKMLNKLWPAKIVDDSPHNPKNLRIKINKKFS